MRTLLLTVLLTLLTLTTSADETTTNNLLSQDFSTGWSGTATQRHGNNIVAAVNDTYIKSDDVSLKDDANLTEAQLQDGFTSNHSFKYWHWNNYNSTVSSTVTVTGADGEATTQIRTYSSTGCGSINCGSYQSGSDTLSISRSTQTDFDVNVRYDFTDTSNSTSHYSVDLKEPSLTITYESEPLDQSIQDEIENIFEDLEDLQEEVFEDMEEFFFEEETFTFNEEPQFEMEVEMETFTFAEEFIEEFFMEMDEEFFMEDEGMAFEDGPMFEFTDTEMEEIYEETNEIIATFLPMVSEEEEFSSEESFVESDGPIFMESTETEENFTTETFQEEELMEEEPPMMTETFEEEEMVEEEMTEEPTEMAEEEVMEEENTEMAEEEAIEEEPTEMVEATNEEEEEIKEEKSDSDTPKKSTVQAKKLAKQKKIQQKKAIVKNLAKIMDKVDKDIKDISKNLTVKNIIKMQAMTSEQASLAMYQNAVFYKPKDIYLDQLNIFDNRQIYPNTNLASYTQNDKIEIKAKKLNEIKIKKQKLLMELKELKNG
jgi:hypothetical protein